MGLCKFAKKRGCDIPISIIKGERRDASKK